MLRIDTVANTPTHLVFALSGRIHVGHLADLQHLVDGARTSNRAISFDLARVTLIDRATARFFSVGEGRYACLLACPPYIEQWVRSETTIR